jgi:mono/diheme cytochrome c family protein
VNWATGIDMATGRPIENPDARYLHDMFLMYPSALGGHSWHAMAYSPQTGLVYIPAQRFGMPYATDKKFVYRPGNENMGTDQALMEPPDDPEVLRKAVAGNEGRLLAWDPIAQKEAWSVKRDTVTNGGVLATAGGLVFQGTGSGRFEARRADDGKLLWSFPTQSGVIAAPVSYEIDGVQYVAVLAGYGGAYGIGVAADEAKVRPNGRVLIFKLGGKAKLPPVEGSLAPPTIVAESFTKAQIDSGRFHFTDQCGRCHGHGAQSAGVLPDLRRSAALADPALWRSIVLGGALEPAGMASFSKWLTPGQVEDIRAYVALKAKILAEHEGKKK